MGTVVNGHELIDTHLGVFLGGGKGSMTKELLNGTEIGSTVKQMGSEGMPQGMRAYVFDYPGFDQANFKVALDTAGR
jgi:hypothetical protein